MILAATDALRFVRYQAFGKQVKDLYCPRNGKREKPLSSATAPNRSTRRRKASGPRAREIESPVPKSRESGDRPGSLLNQLLGVGEDAREVSHAARHRWLPRQ